MRRIRPVQNSSHRSGFTLIELLVVIAIIAILIALLLPAVQQASEAARRTQCKNHLKQLGLALHNFHDVYNHFPPGAQESVCPASNSACTTGHIRGTTWLVHILPMLDQAPLYNLYDFDLPYTDEVNNAVGNNKVPGFYCPSGQSPDNSNGRSNNTAEQTNDGTFNYTTHYYGIMGPSLRANPSILTFNNIMYNYVVGSPTTNGAYATDGILGQYRDTPGSVTTKFFTRFRDILDGSSNTMMVGERSHTHIPGINSTTMTTQANDWRSWVRGQNGGSGTTKNITYPINSTDYVNGNNFNDISMGSNHVGGAQFLMGDGRVIFISENIDFPLYQTLASRASGEPTQAP
ncbi:MAG: DUF1559 domain-containing protein [Planctomycetaceae bacterium]|nr:DUF1559 domain-containing protein [Planctomycetaceae bacterium]